MSKGPLSDVRVLDFSTLLPGPLATLLLAEAGAEVIKIEPVDGGDHVRSWITEGDFSAYFYAANRSKQSPTIYRRNPKRSGRSSAPGHSSVPGPRGRRLAMKRKVLDSARSLLAWNPLEGTHSM